MRAHEPNSAVLWSKSPQGSLRGAWRSPLEHMTLLLLPSFGRRFYTGPQPIHPLAT